MFRNSHYFYLCFLLLIAPIHLLHFDSYYYWDWSRHLALSYYDGSPMIAYFIKLSTLLFGNTLFALSFVGIFVFGLTGFIIYKTACLTLSPAPSKVAMLLWLFSPIVALDLLNQTTYDAPLTLFWALTIYFASLYIKNKNTKDLYFTGLCIGLMMLSKYSGVVLILSLLIFVLMTKFRFLLKSYHFYAAILLSILVFSPVIIWNYQHDWQSWIYQLNEHQTETSHSHFLNLSKTFFIVILPILNFFLFFPLGYTWKKNAKKTDILSFCFTICLVFVCFYLVIALHAKVKPLWLSQFLITSAILGGFCYQENYFRRTIICLIGTSLIASVVVIIGNTTFFAKNSRNLAYYHWVQEVNHSMPHLPDIVITSGWMEARKLFFLKNKPMIYTLSCLGAKENQYRYWTDELLQTNATQVLYIDTDPDKDNRTTMDERKACVEKYFGHCEAVSLPGNFPNSEKNKIFTYLCTKKNVR